MLANERELLLVGEQTRQPLGVLLANKTLAAELDRLLHDLPARSVASSLQNFNPAPVDSRYDTSSGLPGFVSDETGIPGAFFSSSAPACDPNPS